MACYLSTSSCVFRKSTFKKDQQMLSAQMLSGIPEVDLGIEAKIQNIERTEKAKRKLIEEAKMAGLKGTKDSNTSSNYVQHDRYDFLQGCSAFPFFSLFFLEENTILEPFSECFT